MLFSREEEKEAQFGVKPVGKKVEAAEESSELGTTQVEESEKVKFLFFLYILIGFVSHLFL